MNLEEIAETIGTENFDAKIVDGSMIITPSDAGIQIFAAVAMAEEQIEKAEAMAEASQEIIENLRQDNADLRDLLERTYSVLIESGQTELADEVINAAYPIVGIYDDGTEVEIEG
jgi:hypothetical protein